MMLARLCYVSGILFTVYALFSLLMYFVHFQVLFLPTVMLGFIFDRNARLAQKMQWWESVVEEFDKRYALAAAKDVEICPQCFSPKNVIKKDKRKRRYKCNKCNYKFKRGHIPGFRVPAFIIDLLLNARRNGLGPEEAVEHLHFDLMALGQDEALVKSAVYSIEDKVLSEIAWLDELIFVWLLEGLNVEAIEIDEIFQNKNHRRKLKELDREGVGAEERKKAKNFDFYYVINGVTANPRFPLPPLAAYSRDELAFLSYALEIRRRLRKSPSEIHCDDLRQLTAALRTIFPESVLKIVIRRRVKKGIWIKEQIELTARAERQNRTLRSTLRKRKKFGAMTPLQNLGWLNYFYNAYIKRYVESIGLKWPESVKTYTSLLMFARFVRRLIKKPASGEPALERSLREEIKLLESPFGKLILNVKVEPGDRFDQPVLIMNNELLPEKRAEALYSFMRGKKCCYVGSYRTVVPATIVETAPDVQNIVIDNVEEGNYTVVAKFFPKNIPTPLFVIFNNVFVSHGKINHYDFKFTTDELLERLEDDFITKLREEAGMLKNYGEAHKLLEDCFFARRVG